MSKMIWDMDDGDFLFQTSDNTAMDTEGNLMLKISDNFALDMDSGDMHFVSSWNNSEEDDD